MFLKSEERARLLTQWGFVFSIKPGKENRRHTRRCLLCNGKPVSWESMMIPLIRAKIREKTNSNPSDPNEWGAWVDVMMLLAHGRL